MSPGPGTQHLGLVGKRRDTRANHGRQGQHSQEPLKGSARAPGGFCTHHGGLEWPPQKMNSDGKAADGPAGDSKQTNWPPCL